MSPGILYRLSVYESDGSPAKGFPKIYSTERGFRQGIKMQEQHGNGRTMIKEGCARGPWLNLDGPVEPKPEAVVFYEAA